MYMKWHLRDEKKYKNYLRRLNYGHLYPIIAFSAEMLALAQLLHTAHLDAVPTQMARTHWIQNLSKKQTNRN